tara:strand:+ start:182 stop:610 length:429 start_codon:yes stop_codon:yes gene_type:complete
LAGTIGLGLFRPVVLPRFRGAPSDLETAREAMREKVPRVLDSLEAMLDNQKLFVGSQVSIADIAVSSQLANMELVSGPLVASRWPGLAAHLAAMKSTEGFQRNLIACEKLLEPLLPEPVDLGSGIKPHPHHQPALISNLAEP